MPPIVTGPAWPAMRLDRPTSGELQSLELIWSRWDGSPALSVVGSTKPIHLLATPVMAKKTRENKPPIQSTTSARQTPSKTSVMITCDEGGKKGCEFGKPDDRFEQRYGSV
ncbi:hypothetical protein AOLI_G00141090 [Acnodon oligacanthus]